MPCRDANSRGVLGYSRRQQPGRPGSRVFCDRLLDLKNRSRTLSKKSSKDAAKKKLAPPDKRADKNFEGPKPKLKKKYCCFKLRLGNSKIHRWGVYAKEDIPARRKVIEYTGERINRKETKRRSQSDLHYLFTLDKYWTIDGAVGGSGAEFINHCCEPNLFSQINKGHILYMSMRKIKKGEELTVDYHFDANVEKIPCSCGAKKCRGTINVKKE